MPETRALLFALAGFINRQQQDIIEYYREENRVLREKIGNRRLILNVAQKRRLATAAMKLGRKVLNECTPPHTTEGELRRSFKCLSHARWVS